MACCSIVPELFLIFSSFLITEVGSFISYLGLFGLAFSAATLLPGGSELALLGLARTGAHDPLLLLVIASLGNVLGSCVNYWLGRGALHFQDRRWFPVSKQHMANAQTWFDKWGHACVLLAWVPVIGDPITLVAGVLRMPLGLFLLLVTLSKVGRYAALLFLANLLFPA